MSGSLVAVITGTSFAQTSSTSTTPSANASQAPVTTPILSPVQQTYRQEQGSLADQMAALMAQGATVQQINAWRQQNAARLAAQLQRAQAMGAASTSQTPIMEVPVPEGASPDLVNLMTTQADLCNRAAQLHAQATQAAVSQPPQAQSTSTTPTDSFQQQNAAELQEQIKTAQRLAMQSAHTFAPMPQPPIIPASASPQLRAYLTQCNQLQKEQAQLWNNYRMTDPSVRDAALQLWQQQNASRFRQLQEQAQTLSSTQN